MQAQGASIRVVEEIGRDHGDDHPQGHQGFVGISSRIGQVVLGVVQPSKLRPAKLHQRQLIEDLPIS